MKPNSLTNKRKYIGIERIQARWGIAFVVPAILFFSLFSFYPILNALYTSLFDKRVLSLLPPDFMVLGTNIYLFKSADFWTQCGHVVFTSAPSCLWSR